MLIWVAALHCEAKPVIDYFKLKKNPDLSGFDVFQNDSMLCVISGIGKTMAAAATAWIAALNQTQRSIAWINIGTVGCESTSIGTLLNIIQIRDADLNQTYYPVPVIQTKIVSASCRTLNQPCYNYDKLWAYDMEASAFFEIASRFSSAEIVQCLKVVSDNSRQKTGRDKNQISQLIFQNMEQIADYAEKLQALNKRLENQAIPSDNWKNFLSQAHFTQTQKSQLGKLLKFMQGQRSGPENIEKIFSKKATAAVIIAQLEQLCSQTSRNL